jgi:hypothetical protein
MGAHTNDTMNVVRSVLLLSGAILALVACGSAEDNASSSSPPTLGVQYGTMDLASPFESVEFEAGGRYIATRRPCASASCSAVEERGSYELHGSEIVFVDDATHSAITMPYSVSVSAKSDKSLTKALAPASLTEGSQGLVSGGSAMTGESSKLVNDRMQLLDKQYALVLCSGGLGVCSYIGCGGRGNAGAATGCLGGASFCCGMGG